MCGRKKNCFHFSVSLTHQAKIIVFWFLGYYLSPAVTVPLTQCQKVKVKTVFQNGICSHVCGKVTISLHCFTCDSRAAH